MKKLIIITLSLFLLTACKTATEKTTETPETTTPTTTAYSYQATIDTCDSLCEVDKEEYCLTERVITVDGAQKTGTCRSFSKKGNVTGFSRCQGFCAEYGKIE